MRKSTVVGLRTRLREYENDSNQVLHEADLRFVTAKSEETEHQFDLRRREWIDARNMRLKNNFLEDTLKIYQAELQYHVGEEKRDRKDFERDVVKEMEVLDETNKAVMRQLRQSQVEVESMQEVQEELHKRASTHYERLLARHKERSENTRRVLENENAALRLRVGQLETSLQNWKKMEETEASTEANDANYRMSLLKEEVKEKNLELKRSIQHQHKLEQSLSQSREQLQLVLDFIDGCGSSAQRVEMVVKQVHHEHNRLVNRLLNVANSDSSASGYDSSSSSSTGATTAAGGGGGIDDKENSNALILGGDENNNNNNNDPSGLNHDGDHNSYSERLTNDVVRLQKSVDRICEAVHEQHVELALAIDSAATVWEDERRQLVLKHREAISHGQTLQTRILVVEKQAAAAQEDALIERDRALQLRDQAIVFLRAKDMKEHRQPMRHAEVQTVSESLLSQAQGTPAPAAAAGAGGQGQQQGQQQQQQGGGGQSSQQPNANSAAAAAAGGGGGGSANVAPSASAMLSSSGNFASFSSPSASATF